MLNANIDLSIPFSENVHEHQAKSGIEIGAQNNHQNVWNKPVDMGTSIMAVEFDGGVIIGADSRTSMGPYVSNRVSNKLTEIHDNIYVCRSGSAADTQALADVVAYNIGLISIEEGEAPQVKSTARLFQHLCYDYKNNLTAGIICAGWDRVNGGSVYGIPLGGTMVKQPFAIGGSGSTFIYGYCDANYRENMSRDECVEFVKNALALAMARDGSSGGVIRYAIITKDGVEKQTIPGDQLPRFYDK
eukprot:gb/GECH01011950.1/.p1 GENE.gb/GECH01011950.1/~~gb/GECH01011950.1/.p1  ORF type:complete len:245 (+),score=51.63 gb/GECH01011950.1/:1-735(+)